MFLTSQLIWHRMILYGQWAYSWRCNSVGEMTPKCLTVYKTKQNIKFKAVSRIEDQRP